MFFERLRSLLVRLRTLFHRGNLDRDLRDELEFHLVMREQDSIRAGMPKDEAYRVARRQFGNVELLRQTCRDLWTFEWQETVWQDVKYGARMLRRNNIFTAVAVLSLAVGIGANTAIFSVVNTVLLQPLPYPDFSRLVMVWEKVRLPRYENDLNDPAPGNFADWGRQNSVFVDMAAIQDRSFNLTGAGEPVRVEGEAVSASLFSLLGIRPALGRAFNASEDVSGGPRVVVMGHALWESRFGGDPGILNQKIYLDGATYTVVGIMPRGFLFPDPANFHLAGPEDQLWVPIGFSPSDLANRRSHNLQGVLARLKPGVTLAQAQAQMDGIGRRLAEQFPRTNAGAGSNLLSLRDLIVGNTRPALWVLLGAVSLILLMISANVANLLLARASTRRRELALRAALGAGRARLVRQLLTESLLIALAGGALGVLLAAWVVRLILRFTPSDFPLFGDIGVSGPVLAFSLLVSVFTGLVFGIYPALTASQRDAQEGLKEGAPQLAAGSGQTIRNSLIVAEIALGVIVLAGAGLLLRSFLLLEQAPLGFHPEGLLTFRIIPRTEKYAELPRRVAFYQQALEKMSSLPCVKSAAAVSFLPLGLLRQSKGFSFEGRPAPEPDNIPIADYDIVSPGYFRAMQIPFLEGRDVAWSDAPQTLEVVVINQAMAQTFWPGQDPLGKRIKQGLPEDSAPWLTVVGVVGNAREFDVASPPRPTVYFPISQFDAPNAFLRDWVLRAERNPAALGPAIQDVLRNLDKDLPISRMRIMEQVSSLSVARPKFNLLLLGLFAGLAVIVATAGVYGVTTYSISQRNHEIGIRMALGAGAGDVLRLIVGQGARLALVGIAMGLGGALALAQLMKSLLYGVSARDPLAFAGAAILLAVATLAACFFPAQKAAKVDPMVALRCE